MNKQEQVIKKAESGEGLTVEEIKVYQEAVKPVRHVYGKYAMLKKLYLEEMGIDWTIADLPTYLHGIDRQADELQETMREKLAKDARYRRTGDYMENVRRINAMQQAIEEEILAEIIYVA